MISLAHIHPMLVHFPIVLLMLGVVLDFAVLFRRGDLSGRQCLPLTAMSALYLGTLAAVVAAIFGDIALDQAIFLGFPSAPLETHQLFGLLTVGIFALLSLLRLLTRWRHYALAGGRGWLVALLELAGVLVLLVTAYYGGNLVYQIGVNVVSVKP